VRLDLSVRPELDVTALQLLWAAEREARRSGKAFELAAPVPPDVLRAVGEAGFENFPFAGPRSSAGSGFHVGVGLTKKITSSDKYKLTFLEEAREIL